MRIAFEVLGRLDWRRAIEELNLSGFELAELQAYDDLWGIGYSRRDDARMTRHTSLLLQADGVKDIEADLFDYTPRTDDPPTDDLERRL